MTITELDRALTWYARALPRCPNQATRLGLWARVDQLLDERNTLAGTQPCVSV